jgi:hypothetical protein
VGLQYKAIRAAATAVLVAAAVGTGGMGGLTSAMAADPAMVQLAGTVVGKGDAPLAGIHLTITQEYSPDGGFAATQVVTATDGTFSAEVYAWGTAETPARLTITAAEEIEIVGEACSQIWGVALNDASDVAFAEAAPEARSLVATQTLVGEVCGTTATPPANGAGGHANLTPPPTDGLGPVRASQPDRLGPALTLGFLVGLGLAGALLLPRPGARRRD